MEKRERRKEEEKEDGEVERRLAGLEKDGRLLAVDVSEQGAPGTAAELPGDWTGFAVSGGTRRLLTIDEALGQLSIWSMQR